MNPTLATKELNRFWRAADSLLGYSPPQEPLENSHVASDGVVRYQYNLERPVWYVGMTGRFIRDMLDIDRRLDGWIVQAIRYLSTKTMTPRGDTVKPLGGKLKGLWRIRMGNYRLVYRPDRERSRVLLIAFTT